MYLQPRRLIKSDASSVAAELHNRVNPRWMPKAANQRMAEVPEGLDALISEIQEGVSTEDRVLADAKAYLLDRYDTLESMGVPSSYARELDGLTSLPSSTAAPREIRKQLRPGVQIRYHTQYSDDVNPISGQRDINPYIDPVTGQPMSTVLGRVGDGLSREDIDGYGYATEYVQQQIGRLAGMKILPNNRSNVHDVDFVAGNLRIDGETTRPSWNDPAVQAYTKVLSSDVPDGNMYEVAKDVKGKILDGIESDPKASIRQIVDNDMSLNGGTWRGQVQDPLLGKLYSDKDGIIVTELSDRRHQRNKNNDVNADPVNNAYYQDMDTVRSVIEGYTGDELAKALQVRPNRGAGKDKTPRGRVYVEPQGRDVQIVNRDMRSISPLVEQLYDY